MNRIRIAAIAAVIGGACASPVYAASIPIECATSMLHVQHVGRCSIEESRASSRTIYRNSGPVGKGGFSLVLYVADRGSFVTEGASGDAERYLQSFNETVKNEGRNWSPFYYEDGIYYALFDYRGNRCAAFSKHGPPAGGGYQWLLSGYHCQEGGVPFEELKHMLRFTRVGKPGAAASDAFGRLISNEANYAG